MNRFDAVIIDEAHTYRRLLFVGITRAMRALMVAYPWKQPSPFVAEFAPALWDGEWGSCQ